MALVVRITEPSSVQDRVFSFDTSPIRIGRNRLNEIAFDQLFVSQWHALIRFQSNGVTVMDLGSTNGTSVNGQKLQRETPMQLTSSRDLIQIGNISMTFSFGASGFSQYTALSEEKTLFDAFNPAQWLANLRGDEQVLNRDEFFVAFAMERVAVLIETFARSYVELRNGTDQFGTEMGLHLASVSTPLHDAKEAREVLAYLLDWNAESAERVGEVKRSYADLAVHQVAFLNGVMAGVRQLLNEDLSPGASSGWMRWIPFYSGVKLARMKKKHRSLLEEDRFSRVIFGKAFARAYYAVTGSTVEDDTE